MAWCLIPQYADKFISALKNGEINPEKLADMTSGQRRAYLTKFVGEGNAKNVNSLFESKLLLKNQQQGMVTWAKRVAGLKPEARRDLIAKIQKLEKVLDPKEERAFLADLASSKLGVDITVVEAKSIADLSRKVEAAKVSMESGGDRLAYGSSKVALENYVNELKESAGRLSVLESVKTGKFITEIAGFAKSIKASLDNSALFRQGWKTLWTHPEVWQKNARRSFVDIAKTLKGDDVFNAVRADIVSRPNVDLYTKAKLAVGVVEEAYPSRSPGKIPLLGKLYKASETAYTAFLYRTRADVFDKYVEIANKSGINLKDDLEIKSIGKLVNSLTGRGDIGAFEPSANALNTIFFSPRFLKANIDTLTLHAMDKMSPFARKQAAVNLVKVIGGTAAVLAIANAIKPGSVEIDPRSADFGKIKIGNTRFDVTGGMSSIATLAARLITQSVKSSTSGKVNEVDSGKFGSSSSTDLVYNFFTNKLAPAISTIIFLQQGDRFTGEKPSIPGALKRLLVPIPITTFEELRKDPDAADTLLSMIADALGISTNTYGAKKK